MSTTERFLERLTQRRADDSSWVTRRRQAGAARFEAIGFPTRRDEAWKYTDVRRIAEGEFALATDIEFDAIHLEAQCLGINAYRLVLVDGQFSAELSDLEGMPDGVQVEPLSRAVSANHEAVDSTIGRLATIDFSPFTALNAAFADEGVIVRLAPCAVVDKPIYVLLLSRTNEQAVMSHPRILVEAGARSEATIIEHYSGEFEAANFTNVVTEVLLDCGAIVNHYKLQEAALADLHVASIHVDQSRNSRFNSYNLNFGGALVRTDLVADLNGEGAEVAYNGLFLVQGRQHVDNHTLVNHNSPRTFSNENYKGVLDDRARGVFNGKAFVKKGAQQIEAYQNNANLLLSDCAEINTKPELMIYADDVKCFHGATTGQLDEDAVYALRSRGINEPMARALLTLAFVGEVVDKVRLKVIAERIEQAIVSRLSERFNLTELVETAEMIQEA